MAKAPAYQMYASDFATNTAHLSIGEVGIYVRLLNHQWINGSVPPAPERMARIAGCDSLTLDDAWPEIEDLFEVGDDGLLRNRRMEEERGKQASYRAVQSDRAKEREAKKRASQQNPDQLAGSELVASLAAGQQLDTTLQSSSSSSSSPSTSQNDGDDARTRDAGALDPRDELIEIAHKKPGLEEAHMAVDELVRRGAKPDELLARYRAHFEMLDEARVPRFKRPSFLRWIERWSGHTVDEYRDVIESARAIEKERLLQEQPPAHRAMIRENEAMAPYDKRQPV